MTDAPPLTTTVSTKGQVILPKSIRDHLNWGPGAKLVVEEAEGSVVLRRAPLFEPTRVEDVFGILGTEGPARSIEEMDTAVMKEAARRAHDWRQHYRPLPDRR